MKVETVKCDVCGRVKGEANKWLSVFVNVTSEVLLVCPPETIRLTGESSSRNRKVSIDPFEIGREQDICSDACLQKRLGEVLVKIRGEA